MPITRAEALDRTAGRVGKFGFFFDFDGTLAPIREDPATARLAAGVGESVARLAAVARRVTIVSARPVAFLRERFTGVPVTLSGMYGLELGDPQGHLRTDPEAEAWIPVVSTVTSRAEAELAGRGVYVEPKRLSVALHYRRVPGLGAVVDGWARWQAAETGLSVQSGRMVRELRPPLHRDKGTAVQPLLDDLDGAWFVGDDVADIRAFEVLGRRERADARFLAIRVAVTNGAPVDRLTAQADFTLAGPSEVGHLIAVLAAARPSG